VIQRTVWGWLKIWLNNMSLPIVQPDGKIISVPYAALMFSNLIDENGCVDKEVRRKVIHEAG
jgi:hypothetical protein